MLEGQVKKLADGLPESAATTITARMKPDVLRMIDRAGEISPGIGPLEKERLTLLLSEVIVDRLFLEIDRARERA